MATRDVVVFSKYKFGKGHEITHPFKCDYSNPIHAVYYLSGCCDFRFETKDGCVSEHPNSKRKFMRKQISSEDAQITKIRVWFDDKYVYGCEVFSGNEVVLEVGSFIKQSDVFNLNAGERLVGVRMKLVENLLNSDSALCNLVLVIGRLE